jgi:hypothetical protein
MNTQLSPISNKSLFETAALVELLEKENNILRKQVEALQQNYKQSLEKIKNLNIKLKECYDNRK